MHAHFFPTILESFQIFSGAGNFILFKNLVLYIWPLFVLGTDRSDRFLNVSVFRTDYLITISLCLWALANLECQQENKLK